MDECGVLFAICFWAVMAFCVGFAVADGDNFNMLESCKKINNVYECEIVAIPKGDWQ